MKANFDKEKKQLVIDFENDEELYAFGTIFNHNPLSVAINHAFPNMGEVFFEALVNEATGIPDKYVHKIKELDSGLEMVFVGKKS